LAADDFEADFPDDLAEGMDNGLAWAIYSPGKIVMLD
jgi:hypothetical protein